MPDHIGAREAPDVAFRPGNGEAQGMTRPQGLARQIVGVDAPTSFVEIVEDFLKHDGAFEIEVGKSRRKKQVAQNVESAPQVTRVQRDLIERVVVSGLPDEHSAALFDGAVERE